MNERNEERFFLTDFLVSLLYSSIVLFAVLTIIFVCLIASKKLSFSPFSDGHETAVENMIWANEHYSTWNALYESGDYELMYETVKADISKDHPYTSWKHADFYACYGDYKSAVDYIGFANGVLSAGIIYDYLRCYSVPNRDYLKLSSEDHAALNTCFGELSKLMVTNFNFPVERTEELYRQVSPDGYIKYDLCKELAEALANNNLGD